MLLLRRTSSIATLLVIAAPVVAHAQATLATYERALALQSRFANLVVNQASAPVWLASGKFWYRKTITGGNAFVLVDPATPAKAPAFDHARLAAGLGRAAQKTYTAATLPFSSFTFTSGEQAITFATDSGSAFTCTLSDYACTRASGADAAAAAAAGDGGGRGGRGAGGRGAGGRGATGAGGRGRGAAGGGDGGGVPSPDGQSVAYTQANNIFVRSANGSAAGTQVTTSGTAEVPFTSQSISWSPDSKKIAANKVRQGDRRMVRYVESSPTDQLQPKTTERFYAKPGDVLDRPYPSLIDVASRREIVVDTTLIPNPYTLQRATWWSDSRAFTMDYNQRGHQVFRVFEVDGTTGNARALIDEQSKTFIYYNATGTGLGSGRRYRLDIADGKEIIWMSERDGWAHLYLYDGVTGRVKNQITKGDWLVRGVVRVDTVARQIWFGAGGSKANQDPYLLHFYRINFDGTGLTALTDADGNHDIQFSPDNRYYVDTWTRVDLPPVTQLRSAADGKPVLDLERADAAPLKRAGFRAPEVFVAKGRDGKSDIYGIIIRPTRFDSTRKYPVIENIYAGPHGSHVPKTWSAYNRMMSLAEMGFIVVQIDGMGTANRSKAFHDVAWKNLGDAGFPDRILWHKAVAKKYPASYDITRVGIYGGSAGGQNSTGALLFHPEFYDVAVSFAGCHDNRMDKIWWNEQWMGWPIGPEYAASSNMVNAGKLKGRLLLIVGELDTNVDPASTLQVVNALIKADKSFDMLFMPGEEHGAGRSGPSQPYGDRKLYDFFITHLQGATPPNWNSVKPPVRLGLAPAHDHGLLGDGGASWAELEASWNSDR